MILVKSQYKFTKIIKIFTDMFTGRNIKNFKDIFNLFKKMF